MPQRDTGRIEKLLALTRQSLKWARAEMEDGFDCSAVYHQLQAQEQTFAARLTELREHNKREAAKEAAAKPETAKP